MTNKKHENSSSPRPIASTFQIVEAYKTVRTNLLFTLAPHDQKIVLISSAEPNAGKSTVSSNLAITMAQTGARVLLIDADLRKPSQHRTFRVKKHNGLSRVLTGELSFEECVCRGVAQNTDLLPSGSLPPNPSELLSSQAMNALLKTVCTEYDYVLIDTPPLGVVSDALVLCDKAAGIVLVTRQGQTTYDEIHSSIEAVGNVEGKLLGVIISDVNDSTRPYRNYTPSKYYKSYNYSYSQSPDL